MEKTKEQILLDKLRKVGHRARMGGRPPMPPHHGGPEDRRPSHGMPPMHGGPMPPHGGPEGHRPPHGMLPMQGGSRPPMHGRPGPMPPQVSFPRELLLLTVLEAGEDGIRQKDIGEQIGINPSSLSEQIDRLEVDRYLERRANPEDKRSTLIVLTEKGRARAYELQDERQQAAKAFCAKLSEEEQDTLIQLLDKLLED